MNLFRHFLGGFLTIFVLPIFATPLSYTITKSPYLLSTYFEMSGKKDQYEGRVIKEFLSLRTIYDLYDAQGALEATGVCPILSLGTVFQSLKNIDVSDKDGNPIGYIYGRFLTTSRAEYQIYDPNNQLLAIAHLDLYGSGFTLTEENGKTIARLKRNFVQDDIDSWTVFLYEERSLDRRIFQIFSAFVSDSQWYFRADL